MLPNILLLGVGVLILALGSHVHDVVFGILILSFGTTLIGGICAILFYVHHSAALARRQTEAVQRVSHDLRTPLTSIRMFVETLQSGRLTDPERVRECLDLLAVESTRLSGLVERLLLWASLEAGRPPYARTEVSPEVVVDEALAAVKPQVELLRMDGEVVIDRQVEHPLPKVAVDRAAIVAALVNLLQNALRFTGPRKHIVVTIRQHRQGVEISVADDGCGIAPRDQRRVFQQFVRLGDGTGPAGTGLGLSIVHHVVCAHGGRVSVQSDVGKGARFNVVLPAVGGRPA